MEHRSPDSEALITAGRMVAALAAVAIILGVVARRVLAKANAVIDHLASEAKTQIKAQVYKELGLGADPPATAFEGPPIPPEPVGT